MLNKNIFCIRGALKSGLMLFLYYLVALQLSKVNSLFFFSRVKEKTLTL